MSSLQASPEALQPEKFKILFYTREGRGQAGFETRVLKLSEFLSSKGFNTEILSLSHIKPQIPEHRLSIIQKILLNIKAYLKMGLINPQVLVLSRIHYHLPGALLFLLLHRTSLILDLDDWEAKENLKELPLGFTNSLTDNLTKWICSRAKTTVVASRYQKEYFTRYSRNLILIPSAIDSRLFFSRESFDKPSRIVWCGSLEPDHPETFQDLIHFIKFFINKGFTHLKLTLAVRGRLLPRLKDCLLQSEDERIELLPEFPYEQIPSLLKNCHIGILPIFTASRFHLSKSPVKLFEYMAAGLIPVASELGEASEIIKENQNGFIVSTAEEMIERINRISNLQEEVIKSLILNTQKSFQENYSLESRLQDWTRVLN